MGGATARSRPPLRYIALRWVLAAAGLGLIIPTLLCLAENLHNEAYLLQHFIAHEARDIADSIVLREGELQLTDAGALPYFNDRAGSYGFRILDAHGQILAAHNRALIEAAPTPPEKTKHDFWYHKLRPDWLHFSGGIKHVIDGREIWIELATAGDPGWRRLAILLHELAEDVWLPLVPATLIIALFLAFSLHRALKPLELAASHARALDIAAGPSAFDTSGMPREVAEFTGSMNALIARTGSLIQSREHLASFVAHEVKTPLASMLLDLEQIVDERARKLEEDVMELNGAVDDFLTFARSGNAARERVSLEAIVRECAGRAQTAARDGREISVVIDRPSFVLGHAALARHAVQNLIDNAVKHTPPGTAIRVTCGPGPVVTVEDSGFGMPEVDAVRLTQPFQRGRTSAAGNGIGLAIAKHSVALMGGAWRAGAPKWAAPPSAFAMAREIEVFPGAYHSY